MLRMRSSIVTPGQPAPGLASLLPAQRSKLPKFIVHKLVHLYKTETTVVVCYHIYVVNIIDYIKYTEIKRPVMQDCLRKDLFVPVGQSDNIAYYYASPKAGIRST